MSDAEHPFHALSMGERPTFAAPWEADAFALAVAAHDRGLFTWPEWSAALGATLRDADHHHASYYQAWLSTLERLCVAKQVVSPAALAGRAQAWAKAGAETPHGHAVCRRRWTSTITVIEPSLDASSRLWF